MFSEDLDKLSDIILKSSDKHLQIAFRNFLMSYSDSMKEYTDKTLKKNIEDLSKMFTLPILGKESEWDVELRNE